MIDCKKMDVKHQNGRQRTLKVVAGALISWGGGGVSGIIKVQRANIAKHIGRGW